MAVARLVDGPFSPERELAEFSAQAKGAGAIFSFVGVARHSGKDGGGITSLYLEHHPRLTKPSLEAIGHAAFTRFGLAAARVVHRCGDIHPGEPIVFAAAASAHRRAAFEATDYMMDRLKSEAFFWKREDGPNGSKWIEPTAADASDLARWSD